MDAESAATGSWAEAALARQIELLLTEIGQSDRPLIWLWSWPGSGLRRLIARLLASGSDVAELTARRPAELEQAVASARAAGAHRFVLANGVRTDGDFTDSSEAQSDAPDEPDAWCGAFADLLRFGEQAVLAAARPPEVDDADRALVMTLGPADLRLPVDDLRSALVDMGHGAERLDETVAALEVATQGWYQPLCRLDQVEIVDQPEVAGVVEGEGGSAVDRRAVDLVERFRADHGWRSFVRRRLATWLPLARRLNLSQVEMPLLLQGLPDEADAPGSVDRASAVRPPAGARSTTGQGRDVSVRLSLFGVPELMRRSGDGNEAEVHFPHRRLMVLLALLATADPPQRDRDELLEALWPQRPVDRALQSLRPALSHLRRLLRPQGLDAKAARKFEVVGRQGRFYRLGRDIDWAVDVTSFRSLISAAKELGNVVRPFDPDTVGKVAADPELERQLRQRCELLTSAWRLYRGEFLAGHDVSSWVEQERQRLQRAWQGVLRDLGSSLVALGDHERALDAYRALLQSDPTLEEVNLDVIRIYLLQGRRHLARRQWERLCERLLFELDSRPLDETVRVYSELMG